MTLNKLKIELNDNDTITIEGTTYDNSLFRELGCDFPAKIGHVLRVIKKENGVITLQQIDNCYEKSIKRYQTQIEIYKAKIEHSKTWVNNIGKPMDAKGNLLDPEKYGVIEIDTKRK